MVCPQCNTGIHPSFTSSTFFSLTPKEGGTEGWTIRYGQCPECRKAIIYLGSGTAARQQNGSIQITANLKERIVEPLSGARPCPIEVPKDLANDFKEAATVISISPQASAALTRRSLQHLLRDYAGTTKKDLAAQIDEVLANNTFPSSLGEQLDAVRNIGNFAAHPLKSTSTGEIIPVELEEAEWNLDVLEELFDHFFVKPARAKARKDDLNKKLVAAGKPQLP
jgi:hypothetical protein